MKTSTALTALICLVLVLSGLLGAGLGWPLTVAMSLLLAQSTNDSRTQLTKAES